MEKVEANQADLITLDSGQGYFAGRYHNMMPLVAENYNDSRDISIFVTFLNHSSWMLVFYSSVDK